MLADTTINVDAWANLLLTGLGNTLLVTAGGAVVALTIAFTAGTARLSRFWVVRSVAVTYIETFRGTSALVQLYFFFFALPLLGVALDAIPVGIVVLGLNIGAYGAEVVRGAVQSVPKGQTDACIALNLTRTQAMWRVIVPQALVGMIPPWGNLMIELLKNTALVALITVHDLTFQGRTLINETQRPFEIYAIILVVYFVIAQLMIAGARQIERRLARGRDRGGMK